METGDRSISNCRPTSMFKSYYVVWKRLFVLFRPPRKTWFKSYYVVWKQSLGATEKEKIDMFKSYYVVWKLAFSILARKKS